MGAIASKRTKMVRMHGLPGKDGDATSDIQMVPRSLVTRYESLNSSGNPILPETHSTTRQRASEPSSCERFSDSSSSDFAEMNVRSPSVVTLRSRDDSGPERADISEQTAEVASKQATLSKSFDSVDETLPTSILNSFVSREESPSAPLLKATKSDQGKYKKRPAKYTSSKSTSVTEERVSSTASTSQDSDSDKVELLSCNSFDNEEDSGVGDVAVGETNRPASHTDETASQKDQIIKSKTPSSDTLPSETKIKHFAWCDDSRSNANRDKASSPVHSSLRKQRKEFDFFDSDNCKNDQMSMSKNRYKKSLSSNVVLRGRDLTPQEKVLQELRSQGIVKVEDLSVKLERRQYQGQSILQDLRDKGILQSDGSKEGAEAESSTYASRPRYMPQKLIALNPKPTNQVQYSRLKAKDDEVDDLLDTIDMEVEKSDEDYLGSTGKKLLLDKKLMGTDKDEWEENGENKKDDFDFSSGVSMGKTNMEKKLEELRKQIWLTEQRMQELDTDLA